MMKKITPRVASGFPEYLPEDQLEFNRLLAIIREIYELHGFSPIDTPDLELREVLLAKFAEENDENGENDENSQNLKNLKNQENLQISQNENAENRANSDEKSEINKQIYEFSRGKNDFALRYDLTVPLARFVAEHQNDLTFPFKRYQIGKVHRAERAQAGRFREFYQCDIDVIGAENSAVDAEFPAIINEIFAQFNFGEFEIHVNDRKILNGFFAHLNIDFSRRNSVMRTIDKIAKISRDEFREILRGDEINLTEKQISAIENFIEISEKNSGNNDEILQNLANLQIENAEFCAGIENLTNLLKYMRAFKIPENRIKIDLKIARGLDYYTGTVYETFLTNFPEIGSVCSGGRYDNLTEFYTDKKLSGVGISIGLTRLFYKMRELKIVNSARKSPAKVVILPISDAEIEFCAEISRVLREEKIANFLYCENVKFAKKMQFADKAGFDFALIVGENEVEKREISLKNLARGETEMVKFDEITNLLKEKIGK